MAPIISGLHNFHRLIALLPLGQICPQPGWLPTWPNPLIPPAANFQFQPCLPTSAPNQLWPKLGQPPWSPNFPSKLLGQTLAPTLGWQPTLWPQGTSPGAPLPPTLGPNLARPLLWPSPLVPFHPLPPFTLPSIKPPSHFSNPFLDHPPAQHP